ncbi:bile acid-CoA:amino acid N-acyltransferase-like [Clarias gariepinus]|uniref:bile acid-CoA:amino acid N-acyltransferase-like n=1 Tax=Clarias gariepinus TaxID=13013 RepID=UPI00234DF30C|nr:bile acid-CoA:amino acid N-acyltransferase-like [Clarias gariepinus]XP_053369894.1 bile acid-CoA:amino acid N-acyltransferase-like [Clarias gariepinus]
MSKLLPCPFLSVRPLRCMVDEKFEVRVQGLVPGARVTLHALLQSEDGDFWEGFGHYVSDKAGNVSVSEDASLGGSYDGVEAMGLLWSMKPIPGSRTGLRFRKKDVKTPLDVHISVYENHLNKGFQEKPPMASVVVQRWYISPGIQRVEVTEHDLKAVLFIPPGPGPFPAVLDLWGGGGGLVEYRSALLASRGYVALVLEYIGLLDSSGRPYQVDNEYFEAAYSVLKQHPQVCPERIAILGLSFGVSVTLGMAAYSSVIKPRCVVCVSGSHIMPVNGTLADVFAEITKNYGNTRYDEEKRIIWRDLLLPVPDDASKKVEMGRILCPILLIVGEDDQNWPASESAEDMKQMMEQAGNSHLLTTLSYPGAGHLIEPPYSPHCRASNYMLIGTRKKVVVLWGGQTVPHSHAQEDSWHKTLAFLEQHLYSNLSH